MYKTELPNTDSVKEVAEFWDTHEITDFEDELEEVTEPVFVRGTPIKVHLQPQEIEAVQKLAKAHGTTREELIHAWIVQQIAISTP